MSDASDRLTLAVDRLGQTYKHLAEEIGMAYTTIQKYLRGERDLTQKGLLKFWKLGINPNWVMTGEGEMYDRRKLLSDLLEEFYKYELSLDFDQEPSRLKINFVNDYNSKRQGIQQILALPRINFADLDEAENGARSVKQENQDHLKTNFGLLSAISGSMSGLEAPDEVKEELLEAAHDWLLRMGCKEAPPKVLMKQFLNLLFWIQNNQE